VNDGYLDNGLQEGDFE
nr:RecName: Full=36 kDa cell wall protein [Nicotiana tabacum]